jgi:hypothetical protein
MRTDNSSLNWCDGTPRVGWPALSVKLATMRLWLRQAGLSALPAHERDCRALAFLPAARPSLSNPRSAAVRWANGNGPYFWSLAAGVHTFQGQVYMSVTGGLDNWAMTTAEYQ